ncbi:lon protease-like protein [Dimargaris cristalligena]|uniref:Lon protease homolog, mitochondrial n=1 Tax=Dimargaris cristalligena TaxID=215637 RepID=A0A4Q0A279_9FUNG|nr:lon protease-like protein [Dimargaris cristalligena]|eukprot:RKP40213.1 lon protease-like protein [Dimargaris cristalligena]
MKSTCDAIWNRAIQLISIDNWLLSTVWRELYGALSLSSDMRALSTSSASHAQKKSPPEDSEPAENEDSGDSKRTPVEKSPTDSDESATATGEDGDSAANSSAKGNGGASDDSGENGESGDKGGSRNGDHPFEAIRRVVDVLENSLTKPSVPDEYTQVLALPIARRCLFPGFYKAVVIKAPEVIAAIKELMKRGQPYVGAFLLKDENEDIDMIANLDQVHKVGVFAQITSVFPSNQDDSSLTAVLYPHRRVRITDMIKMERPKPTKVKSSGGRTHKPSKAAAEQEVLPPVDADEASKPLTTSDETASSTDRMHYPNDFLRDYDVSVVHVDNLHDEPHSKRNQIIRAVTSEIVSVFKDIASLNPLFRDQIANFSMSQAAGNVFEEPAKLADFAAAVSAGEPEELQEILESLVIEERLQKALVVLKKELMNAHLQSKISKDVEAKIAKRQREYYLMEQLKGIKKELGIESDGKDKMVETFKAKAEKLSMPTDVRKIFDEELAKLQHLETAASEFNVTRNYLDWLTQIPWGVRSPENYNLVHARQVLDADHYGLKDVKDRILEFIAVGKLRGTVEGKILCLVGPPGVGKTSVGKSIARSLSREFYRFSVGGLTDVAEIKGHRRTYVGAMPGKVIQALKKVQTENPLVLIDEIDKLGRGHQGDPASALLELLDPEQNNSFLDHYMDVPVDLSKVLFVCTANVLDTIPGPLLDRMEVIQLSGYVAEEKVAIAEKYLAPNAQKANGLENVKINLEQPAVAALIRNYCRESGVRNLKKHIDKIYRKAALKIVQDVGEAADREQLEAHRSDDLDEQGQRLAKLGTVTPATTPTAEKSDATDEKASKDTLASPELVRSPLLVPESYHLDITDTNLKDYVGPPVFVSDRLYDITPPGVVMGLAWTSMGGSVLYIESVVESHLARTPEGKDQSESSSSSNNNNNSGGRIGRGHLSKTGQLGDVMKESTDIAYTFVRSLVTARFPTNTFFNEHNIHLHVPEGATPKDGPSAGVTMTTSLLSLALGKPIPPTVSMTGEITLTGKVLKIGGLKEKTIAAKRSGVNRIFFPAANAADWEELDDYIKEGVEGIPVHWYHEIPPQLDLVNAKDWKTTP